MSGYRFDRLKVLVVDDNQHMRKLVVAILQAFGRRKSSKPPTAIGPGPCCRGNPDVVILDWMMEGMTGIRLVNGAHLEPDAQPFVPIIMLTGYTGSIMCARA